MHAENLRLKNRYEVFRIYKFGIKFFDSTKLKPNLATKFSNLIEMRLCDSFFVLESDANKFVYLSKENIDLAIEPPSDTLLIKIHSNQTSHF